MLAKLLARCAQDDRAAFAHLYKTAAPKLFALALRILKRQDWAEDTLQESFLNIWRHAGDYHPEKGSPMTWMGSILRNRAIDLVRRLPHEPCTETDIDAFLDDAPGPLELTVRSRDAVALRRCLGTLPAPQRQCVLLAYYRALTHQEVAEHMNVPLGTAKTWIRRSLERLKECLER